MLLVAHTLLQIHHGLTATGGVVNDYTDPEAPTYRAHIFTSSVDTVSQHHLRCNGSTVDYLVVAVVVAVVVVTLFNKRNWCLVVLVPVVLENKRIQYMPICWWHSIEGSQYVTSTWFKLYSNSWCRRRWWLISEKWSSWKQQ